MRKLLATLGCVVAIGGMTVVAAPAAHAGVGNCMSAYISGMDDGANATTLGYHALHVLCLANDTDTCIARGGTAFDLAGCLID